MSLPAYSFGPLFLFTALSVLLFFVPGFFIRSILGSNRTCPISVYFESFTLSLLFSGLLFLLLLPIHHSIWTFCAFFIVCLLGLLVWYLKIPKDFQFQMEQPFPDWLFVLLLIPFGVMLSFWGAIHLDGTDLYQHSANIGKLSEQGVFFLPTPSARYDLHNLLFLVPSFLSGINRVDVLIHLPLFVYLGLYAGSYLAGAIITGSRWGD